MISTNLVFEVAKKYRSGLGSTKLSREYGIGPATVLRWVKKLGIRVRSLSESQTIAQKNFRIPEKIEKRIIHLYCKQHFSVRATARKINLPPITVRRILRRNKIKVVPKIVIRRKYKANHQAFRYANREVLYWLGFLMADGCVIRTRLPSGRHQHVLTVALHPRDRNHLYKFRKFLKSNHPIRNYKSRQGYTIVCFSVVSQQLCFDLQKFGIVPRKSLIAQARLGIENSRHFWRGVFDGDGGLYFSFRKNKYRYLNVSLAGSRLILKQWIKFLKYNIPEAHTAIRKKKRIYEYATMGRSARKISTLLYKNSTIYLTRKMNTAKQFFNSECCK